MSTASDLLRLSAAEAVREAVAALEGGEPAVGVAIIESAGSRSAPAPGARLVVRAADRVGSFGAEALDAHAVSLAREVLAGRAVAGAHEVEIGEVRCTLYLEAYRPPAELVIVGAGHIARPLCRLGAMLGLRVTVLDDRPAFATRERFPEAARLLRADFADPLREVSLSSATHLVLVTRGHRYDYDVLRDVLRRDDVEPAYVGMVGSRRRVRAAYEQLIREGIAPERLARVHAPIGLDIGAETPEEIAVAIIAEIVRLRRGGTGASLSEKERIVERYFRL